MFCQKCGKETNEAAAFCPHCGNSLALYKKLFPPTRMSRTRKIIVIIASLISVFTFIHLMEMGLGGDVSHIKSCTFGSSSHTIGELLSPSFGFPTVEWETGVNIMGKKVIKASAVRVDGTPCSMTFMQVVGDEYTLMDITVNNREYSGLNADELNFGFWALLNDKAEAK